MRSPVVSWQDDARSAAIAADERDEIAAVRGRFSLPDDLVYLDGNSLGALQPAIATRVATAVTTEWGQGLIRSWNDAGWIELPSRIATRLAGIVGADPVELAVTDSTSTNLFKVLAAGAALRPDRHVILTDDTNFPTDIYVARGLADLTGRLEVRVVAPDDLLDHLDDDVAMLALTEIDYRSGRRHDAPALTAAAHDVGALAVWDLAHSAGVLDVDLTAWNADLAVGCSYKFLSGGPGAPAFAFAAHRHHAALVNPLAGWFGHEQPFAFDLDYRPAPGAARLLNGTAPVLSMTALEAALEAFDDLDMAQVTAKAHALTTRFIDLVDTHLEGSVEVVTPRDPARRGAQVSLRHAQAYALTRALIDAQVIGDHRPPDIVRFGFAPLYVRHLDVAEAVIRLADLLASGSWDQPRFHERQTVT
jgi:kynureninase